MSSRCLGILEPADLFQHLVVFGATGCGKTRHVILPLLRELLARDAGSPELRAGALVFDVKGDMAGHIRAVMHAAGRTDELITIGRGGNAWFDPFLSLEKDSRAVTERLMEMVRAMHTLGSSSNDDFWVENLRRFLQVAVVLARATTLGDLHGLSGIAKATSAIIAIGSSAHGDDDGDNKDASLFERLLASLDHAEKLKLLPNDQVSMAREYLKTEAQDLAANTWSTITNYAQAYVSCLQDSTLAKILSPGSGVQFFPEQIIDQGRIVLVSLSRVHFGAGSEVFRTLIKTAFQQAALQRHCLQYFDGKTIRPVNSTRPVLFVADEFPSLLTTGNADDGDAFFFDKCRETKIACILSAQGVSAMAARMRNPSRVNHLLNNCCTKVFMASDCPETLGYFDSSVPVDEPGFDTILHQVPAAPSFRLPNYEFAEPARWVAASRSESRDLIRKYRSSVLRQLETGEAVVLRPKGLAERLKLPPFLPQEL